ncbi:thiamine pyrophosphate-dependent enzyme [Larsenimonas suaedae]|uniref:Thiamine pyrophosphate-binding protein n=1 Tax=Larsenimonas suaedae TaxID=1851019 RepID=A0ABU1GRM7_9GAMM|nr:thiamine pyrophosphate-dependent enzyme [Larsenimonas suaedae]MCM2972522.1 thiamine pyrophosphate-binding protein [Larsenimonas suaedae]MDR5894682.1 thiamine pyrophosphate-binding protein [Larsenimonas suaedae]
MSQNVAEIITETLMDAGAKRCYGVVGDTINQLTDAMRRAELDWVHVRHEEVGGFAAGGESMITGELSLCAGTCGPGSLHFVNGLFDAHRSNAPVVFIASQIPTSEAGVGFPQDVDQKPIYEQYSVFCETLTNPNQARRMAAMAAQAALNKRGVAVLIVPGDLFTQTPENDLPYRAQRFNPIIRPSAEEFVPVLEAIKAGKKISIYAGFGCEHARDDVLALAAKLNAPVAWTSRAKDFIEYDNPFEVGMTGVFGLEGGYHAVADCDVLLLLGCNFAWTQFYPDKATIIQVDINAEQIGKRHPVDIGLVGTVRDTCQALAMMVDEKPDTHWLEKCRETYKKSRAHATHTSKDDELIHPQELALAINRNASEDAVFTADGGSPMVWLLRHIEVNGKRRTLSSLVHGTMANAYPQALGVQAAYPGREVIAMCGDGGMSMLMGDLLTLKQLKLPVKLVVFNNSSLGFVEIEQKVEGLLDAFTDLENPDFGEVARAVGLWGKKVEHKHDLDGAMRELLDHDGPGILDVKVNRMELVMPPKIEPGQIASTALYSTKAMLNGRMDDVLDLVNTNFFKR